eukprot:m.23565 g.23565  ORF g.23565 m.23565 type:complete len:359 (-) comp8517_c0_seq2:700-1776(-)
MKLVARYIVLLCVALAGLVGLASVTGVFHLQQWQQESGKQKNNRDEGDEDRAWNGGDPSVAVQLALGCAVGETFSVRDGCQPCPANQTSFPGGSVCEPLLGCKTFELLVLTSKQSGSHHLNGQGGGVKALTLVSLNGTELVLAQARNPSFADFDYGFKNLVALAPHPLVIRPVGFCSKTKSMLLPFYPLGSAENLESIVRSSPSQDTVRLQLVQDYISILVHLHHTASSRGAFVMCDAVTVEKLLSQFLVSSSYRLILNDVDALPLANSSEGRRVKCGHQQLSGAFVGESFKVLRCACVHFVLRWWSFEKQNGKEMLCKVCYSHKPQATSPFANVSCKKVLSMDSATLYNHVHVLFCR